MADEAKAPGRSRTWLWMLLALVVVGGFLTWLAVASEPTSVAVVDEEDGDDTDEGADGATVVVKDTLAADKARFEGQRIRVAQVEATGTLGPRIFWGELGDQSNQVPILVRLDSAAAMEVQSGSRYTVTGQLNRMADSLATAWGEQGEFRGEGEQMQAAFADYYIQASNIRPSRGGATGSDAGGDADASG